MEAGEGWRREKERGKGCRRIRELGEGLPGGGFPPPAVPASPCSSGQTFPAAHM